MTKKFTLTIDATLVNNLREANVLDQLATNKKLKPQIIGVAAVGDFRRLVRDLDIEQQIAQQLF